MSLHLNEIGECGVCCHSTFTPILNFPDYPISDSYVPEGTQKNYQGYEFDLVACSKCGHLQLRKQLDSGAVYSFENYTFRSSKSGTSRRRNEVLARFFEKITPKLRYNLILDVGCNDHYLLSLFQKYSDVCVGLDPIWADYSGQKTEEGILLVGKSIEQLESTDLPQRPDLIICSHTLEHLKNPRTALEKLVETATEDAYFLFEIPNFEILRARYRFDQLFHHHLQYFTIQSMYHLIERTGCTVLASMQNYDHWGSLLVFFTKSKAKSTLTPQAILSPKIEVVDKDSIRNDFKLFEHHCAQVKNVLDTFDELIYGYGAPQLLPIIAYHWKSNLNNLACIFDDDPLKEGFSYLNLDVTIKNLKQNYFLKDKTVVITAIDNLFPILKKLQNCSVKRIVTPISIL